MKSICEKGFYFSKDLKKGHYRLKEDICIKKPSSEMPPAMLDSIIGHKLTNDVKLEDAVTNRSIESK